MSTCRRRSNLASRSKARAVGFHSPEPIAATETASRSTVSRTVPGLTTTAPRRGGPPRSSATTGRPTEPASATTQPASSCMLGEQENVRRRHHQVQQPRSRDLPQELDPVATSSREARLSHPGGVGSRAHQDESPSGQPSDDPEGETRPFPRQQPRREERDILRAPERAGPTLFDSSTTLGNTSAFARCRLGSQSRVSGF